MTTKPEGKGTGLGLSTVLMVVERHNGRVDFDSDEGRGHDLPDYAATGPRLAVGVVSSVTVSWPRSTAAASPVSRQQ